MTTRRTSVLATLLAFVLLTSTIAPAFAAPSLSSKRAQAEAARKQVETLDQQVEVAAEDYNEASERHRAATAKANAATTRLAKVAARLDTLEVRLGTRAEHMYRSGPLSFVEVLLGATDFEQFATVWDLLTDMNRTDAAMVAELRVARAEAVTAKADLDAAKKQAASELATMKAQKKAIEGRLAARKKALAGLESEISRIEAEEAARAEQAARASARKWKLPSFSDIGGNPKREPRSNVVAIAKRYLGVPYVWGGSTPAGFDCSGFTMYVYRQVGVSLPHSSRAQINYGERVSKGNLAPGDLVFFGRSRIHHVGIYIGGGQYIHAPHSGDVVKISSLAGRSDYAGACRP